MDGPFRISCHIRENEWTVLRKIVLHNPRGSSFDQNRSPLRGNFIGSLTGSINFWVGPTPLFPTTAVSFDQSAFALAGMMLRILDTLNESSESVGEIGMLGSDWKVSVVRHESTVQITSNWQSNTVLTCSFQDFVAGAEAFVGELCAEVFVREPMALRWTSLEGLRSHLDKLMIRPVNSDGSSYFDWSIADDDWEEIRQTRRNEPPGSEYDIWAEAASNLFGGSLTFVVQDNIVPLTRRLSSRSPWQPLSRLRRGMGKTIGRHPGLFDHEPWPLLDLAFQLARYLNPSLFSFAPDSDDDDVDGTGVSREVAFENVPRYHFILHHSVLRDLETAIGESLVARAAQEMIHSFVSAIYSQGGGAVEWDCLRVLRDLATTPTLKMPVDSNAKATTD